MNESLIRALEMLAVSLGVIILEAVSQAISNYHPNGSQEQLIMSIATPTLISAIAGAVHWLQNKQNQQ